MNNSSRDTGDSSPRPLRVVSWNLNHWQQPIRPIDTRAAAWEFAAKSLHADVGLFQETVPPPTVDHRRVVYREIADYRPWGSAIVAFGEAAQLQELWAVRTRYSRRRFTLARTYPGSVAIAELTMPGIAPITFVSVYNVIDVYAQTTLLRIVADLIPLFDSPHGSRVILGGDLNMGLTTSDPYFLRRGRGVLGALESLGLVEAKDVTDDRPAGRIDCPCGAKGECRHIATWKGAELDHIYITQQLATQVRAVAVDTSVVGRLSDHAPLVLDLDLTHEPGPRHWSAETFAAEIGRLHGPRARAVVEELIVWAHDKERRLRLAGIRDVDLTRLPAADRATPELWFQIDYRGSVPALMWTVSIRASGHVVVQFRWMRQPPFDEPERREPLRQMLNEIPGVDIRPERLNGLPKFDLKLLYDERSMQALIAVLDRIVDETRPSGGPVTESESAGELDLADGDTSAEA